MKLKEILQSSYLRGFTPAISFKDLGKFCIVYRDENTMVKGSKLYDTFEDADKMLKLIGTSDIVIKQIGFPNG